VIFVTSAGNSAPRIPSLDPAKQTIQAIVVGSTELDGSVSSYSQEGANVALYAPGADPYVLSLQEPYSTELSKGNETNSPPKPLGFGMTSATSPLVAGAVVNLKAYLPDLGFPAAKEILVRSGTPLPGGTGKVLLNEYRAVRVAERLAQEKNWRGALEKETLYDFSAEAVEALRKASQPELCGEEKIQLIRKAFLLKPDPETAHALAEALEGAGWPENARFYRKY
jgi:hypothetical protein